MSECPRVGKFFGGCRFEARHDLGEPSLGQFRSITGYDLEGLLKASKPETYVHDVCVRCGKTVQRAPTNPNSRSGE